MLRWKAEKAWPTSVSARGHGKHFGNLSRFFEHSPSSRETNPDTEEENINLQKSKLPQ
jgi:hypothetical protein